MCIPEEMSVRDQLFVVDEGDGGGGKGCHQGFSPPGLDWMNQLEVFPCTCRADILIYERPMHGKASCKVSADGEHVGVRNGWAGGRRKGWGGSPAVIATALGGWRKIGPHEFAGQACGKVG